jgi:hypothetical protein
VTPLARFQAANDPRRPLDLMEPGEANAALVEIARTIAAARTLTELSRSLTVVDRVAEAVAGEGAPPPGVLARHTGDAVVFEARYSPSPVEVITGADLEQLGGPERLLIRALEDAMNSSFERWADLRARSNRLTARERTEYEAAGRDMCRELGNILDFIVRGLDKHLDDHYHAVRYSCAELVTLTD